MKSAKQTLLTLYHMADGAKRGTVSLNDYIKQVRQCAPIIQDYVFGIIDITQIGEDHIFICSKPMALTVARDDLDYARENDDHKAIAAAKKTYQRIIMYVMHHPHCFWTHYDQIHKMDRDTFASVVDNVNNALLTPLLGLANTKSKSKRIEMLKKSIANDKRTHNIADTSVTISDMLDMHEDRLGLMKTSRASQIIDKEFLHNAEHDDFGHIPNLPDKN